jgi:hypothetical protein
VDVKDSFTCIRQERDAERQEWLSRLKAMAEAKQRRREERELFGAGWRLWVR